MAVARPKLSAKKSAVLAKASYESILLGMGKLRPYLRDGHWLRNNRYKNDVLAALKNERANQAHDPKKLASYLAASIPLHCSDGWAFLSQAVASLLNGDWASALHLAYYAELRASIAFLASEGIGIFNEDHVCIDSAGSCHLVRGEGTHGLTWLALEHWASLKPNASRLLQLLRIDGASVGGWLENAGVSRAARTTVAANWLRAWSLDLRVLSQDQELRNTVSYRPTRLQETPRADAMHCLTMVTEFWRACEPGTGGSFSILDRHLLRIALETGFRSKFPGSSRAPKFHRDFVTKAVNAMGYPVPAKAGGMVDFLVRQKEVADLQLLTIAAQKGSSSGEAGALPVIARATLMLRLASAACASYFRQANVGRDEVAFWWKAYGIDAGLWDTGGAPSEFSDLWKDVEDALVDAGQWCSRKRLDAPSIAALKQDMASDLIQLCSFQRACLWSFGL
ncbi:MAG: hypothetical protein Q8O86_11675 [Dehalococcoidia bacterium]|nr:hypothetical protein [Dehalococcoidia bacterium]